MKIVLENIFMYLVTFWKCYFPPPPTQNPPSHYRKTTKTPPQQQQKNQRLKRESKKSKSHRNVDRFVGRSKSHKKSKSQRERERDRFVSSWRESSGSLAKSKARGSKVLGRRSVREFVDRWVEGSRSKIDSWVRRSTKSKAWFGLWIRRRSRRRDLGSLSLPLSPEMVWSENFDWN